MLEELLLGAPVELNREQVFAQAGVSEDEARAVWLALGFAEVDAGVTAFTQADVEALRQVAAIRAAGVIDDDTLLVLARAMGQGLARLAEAQTDVLRGAVAGLALPEALEHTVRGTRASLPALEQLMVHVWRRQLAAASQRSFAAVRQEGLTVLTVGFVDLEGFTRTSRERSATDLEQLLETFERETALRVAASGGRVIKTIGDAVLYVSDTPEGAVEVALDTVAAHRADPGLPEVRAGLARGPMLLRLGDVFGEPVNLASRLTALARPGSVLADRELAASLEGTAPYDVVTLRRRSVSGYGHLQPHLVRRVAPANAS